MPQTRQMKKNKTPFPAQTQHPIRTTDSIGNGHFVGESVAVDTHPLAHLAGKYNDEPLWEDFLEAMELVRREMNDEEKAAE